MPISFRIIPERGLVVVQYSGFSTIDELMAASAAYVADPDYAAGQKQLVDLAAVTGFERNYVRFMQMQAAKAERLTGLGVQSLAIYIAPTPVAQEVAALFMRSWAHVDNVVTVMQHSEADALALLGQPETTIAQVFATLTPKPRNAMEKNDK